MIPETTSFSGHSDDQTARAYRSIRRMIVDGDLPPGSRTSHRTLAEQLGLGRSPVRDAVLQLEAEGLVVQRGQKGILLRELTSRELAEIYELRLVMEPFFAERAALLATPVQVAAIGESCTQLTAIASRADLPAWLADVGNRQRLYRLDLDMHAMVLAAAGNSIATRIFSSAHVLTHVFSWACVSEPGGRFPDRLAVTAAEHMAIYEAIRDRDPAAARDRMRQHVLDALPAATARYAEAFGTGTAGRTDAPPQAPARGRRSVR